MKPWNSWYCVDCEEIFSSTATYRSDMRCPSCMGSALQSLSVFIKTNTDRKSIHEIQENQFIDMHKPHHTKLNTGQILQTYIQKARDCLCGTNLSESEINNIRNPKRIRF